MLSESITGLSGLASIIVLIVCAGWAVVWAVNGWRQVEELNQACKDKTAEACYVCGKLCPPSGVIQIHCNLSSRRFCMECWDRERERLMGDDQGRIVKLSPATGGKH